MNILFLTNIPTPYRVDFFNELGKLCNLTVLYERKNAANRNSKWLSKNATSFREYFLKGHNVGVDSSLSPEVLTWIKDPTFDLIIIGGYSTPTGILAINYLKLKKKQFVLNIDGGLIKKDNPIKYWIKKYFISSASYWLSPSRSSTEYLVHYGAIQRRIYEYSFTSVREADICDEKFKERKNHSRKKIGADETKMVLTVGQMIYRKGIDIVLNVASKMKNTNFYIVGGEPTNEYLEMKRELDLENVHFIGFKSKEELSHYYHAADLFLLPTREDIWGLVINEAMAYGLPVITTNKCVAGLELIEPGQSGFIVPVNNIEKTIEAVKNILYDNCLRESMALESINKIKQYTIEKMADVHIEIFNKILGRGKDNE